MEQKLCSRCHQLKDLSEFHKRANRSIGVQPYCKACQKIRKAAYLKTPDGAKVGKAYSKNYYYGNREKALSQNKEWRLANKDYRDAYSADYEKNNRKRNPVQLAIWSKTSRQRAISTKPAFRLNQNMSVSVRRNLVRGKNGGHWETLVGYTCAVLENHLKKMIPKGYLWKDFLGGKTDLQIDHIIPIAAFNFETVDDIDFKHCWALNNLRLLPRAENCSKGKKLYQDFQPALLVG